MPQYGGPVPTAKKQKKEVRYKQSKEKQLHGKYISQKEKVRSEETWGWIRKGYLKKESERFIFEAQEQALRMNWIKKILMAKRYQENVEYVRKEMSQSLA